MLIIGGSITSDDVEMVIINAPDGTNSYKPADLPSARREATGGRVGSYPMVCGGPFDPDCYRYDFSKDAWEFVFNLSEPMWNPSSVQIDEDQFWLAGGEEFSREKNISFIVKVSQL